MDPRFDIYITGDAVKGFEREAVIESVARLFALERGAAAELLKGSFRRVKSNCDKSMALKYREALIKAGAEVAVTRHGVAPNVSSSSTRGEEPPLPAEPSEPSKPAEFGATGKPKSQATSVEAVDWVPPVASKKPSGSDNGPDSWDIAPTGSIMSEFSEKPYAPEVAPPDYEIAEVGEVIPTVKHDVTPLHREIDHLHLSPLEK